MAAKGHALLNRIENITTDEERSELKVITGRLVLALKILFSMPRSGIFFHEEYRKNSKPIWILRSEFLKNYNKNSVGTVKEFLFF